LEFQTPGGFLV